MVPSALFRRLWWLGSEDHQWVPYFSSRDHVSRYSHYVLISQPHEILEVREEKRSRHADSQNSQQTQTSVDWWYSGIYSFKVHQPSPKIRAGFRRVYRVVVCLRTSSSRKAGVLSLFSICGGSMANIEEHHWLIQARRSKENSMHLPICIIQTILIRQASEQGIEYITDKGLQKDIPDL